MNRVYDPTVPPERRRFAPGSVSISGMAELLHHLPDSVTHYGQCCRNSVWICSAHCVWFTDVSEKIFTVVSLLFVWHLIDLVGSTD
jgi:hypothetical protein